MNHDATPIWLRGKPATGRRPERSRDEIAQAGIDVAQAGGLEAVSMRNVAAELGTGPASLYRYVRGRDDLLDLMVDATAGRYRLPEPTGVVVSDLLRVAEETYAIMLRHPWLPELVIVRPTLGPNSAAVLEHVLEILADRPDMPAARKFELFGTLNAVVATFARNALADAGNSAFASYLEHVAGDGDHPRIAATLAAMSEPLDVDAQRRAVFEGILTGLLQSRG